MKRKQLYSTKLWKRFAPACALFLAVAVTLPAAVPYTARAAEEPVAVQASGSASAVPFTLVEDKNTAGRTGLWKDISPEGSIRGSSTYRIGATVTGSGITGTAKREDITWQSSDPTVATVDADGVVTGHRVGHADITASYDGYSQKFGINVLIPSDEPYTIQDGVLSYTSASLGKKYHLSVSTGGNVTWNGPVASGTQNVLSISTGSGSDSLYLSENTPCTFSTTPASGMTSKFTLVPASAGRIESVAGDPGKVTVTLYEPATLEVSAESTIFATSLKAMDDFVMKVGETATLTSTMTPADATVQPAWKYEEQTSFWSHYTPGLDTDFDGAVNFDGKTVTARSAGVANFTVSADTADGQTVTDKLQIKVVDQSAKLFDDVRNMESYYFQPVYWAVDKNITSGTTPTQFSPDQEVTRGQMVTFLWRAAGSPAPESSDNPFTDVSESSPYYQAILWAYQKGITSGISTTTFGPGRTCTRAQIVTFLYNYEGKPSGGEDSAAKFTDVSSASYYYKAVGYAVSKNITAGISATTFGPDQTCTRGQAMTFLYRAQNQN